MTDDNELLELAGRAAPGPWAKSGVRQKWTLGYGSAQDSHVVGPDDGKGWVALVPYSPRNHAEDYATAKYIAAANPARITRLISEKRSEAARADLTGFMLAWVVAATRPAQPPRKPYVFHSLSACAGCGCSGDDFGSVNVEAFEMTGELYCDDCADEAIENASQGDDE